MSSKCERRKTTKKESHELILILVTVEHIKLTEHILQTIKIMQKLYHIFIKLRNILTTSMLLKVYYALVQSILQNGILGLGGAYKTNLASLEIDQS